jgi:predicted ribosomally synthesized peptide with SipW-like signal peptide
MSSQTLRISRRKALVALASIGVGSAAVSAGTFAAFSDSETDDGTDNGMETGTLELQFDDANSGQLVLDTTNMRPGESGTARATLQNTGSLDGTLGVTLDSITNTDTQTPSSEPSGGELPDALQLRLWLEPTDDTGSTIDGNADEKILLPDGTVVAGDNATSAEKGKKTTDQFYDTDGSPSTVTWDGSSLPTLSASGTYDLVFDWTLPETATNLDDISDIDAVQGDKSTFNFTFTITGT